MFFFYGATYQKSERRVHAVYDTVYQRNMTECATDDGEIKFDPSRSGDVSRQAAVPRRVGLLRRGQFQVTSGHQQARPAVLPHCSSVLEPCDVVRRRNSLHGTAQHDGLARHDAHVLQRLRTVHVCRYCIHSVLLRSTTLRLEKRLCCIF